MTKELNYGKLIILSLILLVITMVFLPLYGIWSNEQYGKAQLAQAEYSKKIIVEQAKADLESSKHYADAEIIRARGVAEANKIIGDSLKDNEGYLRYLWIQGLHDGSSEVVYIPTEAGLPILEAGKGIKNE